jgi:hypothetical protein
MMVGWFVLLQISNCKLNDRLLGFAGFLRMTFSFGSNDGFGDNFHELFAFINNHFHFLFREKIGFYNQPHPEAGFPQFFEADRQFVNEIGPAFRGSALLLIRRGRRS